MFQPLFFGFQELFHVYIQQYVLLSSLGCKVSALPESASEILRLIQAVGLRRLVSHGRMLARCPSDVQGSAQE